MRRLFTYLSAVAALVVVPTTASAAIVPSVDRRPQRGHQSRGHRRGARRDGCADLRQGRGRRQPHLRLDAGQRAVVFPTRVDTGLSGASSIREAAGNAAVVVTFLNGTKTVQSAIRPQLRWHVLGRHGAEPEHRDSRRPGDGPGERRGLRGLQRHGQRIPGRRGRPLRPPPERRYMDRRRRNVGARGRSSATTRRRGGRGQRAGRRSASTRPQRERRSRPRMERTSASSTPGRASYWDSARRIGEG